MAFLIILSLAINALAAGYAAVLAVQSISDDDFGDAFLFGSLALLNGIFFVMNLITLGQLS